MKYYAMKWLPRHVTKKMFKYHDYDDFMHYLNNLKQSPRHMPFPKESGIKWGDEVDVRRYPSDYVPKVFKRNMWAAGTSDRLDKDFVGPNVSWHPRLHHVRTYKPDYKPNRLPKKNRQEVFEDKLEEILQSKLDSLSLG
jgi:hypothetical protein